MYQKELNSGINNFEYISNVPTGFTINDYKKTSSKANSYSNTTDNSFFASDNNKQNSIDQCLNI